MDVQVIYMTWKAYVRNRKQYNRYRRWVQLQTGKSHEQWPWIYDDEMRACIRWST